ncbi:MAG: amidohydrolase [Halanaerobiales bacterium]
MYSRINNLAESLQKKLIKYRRDFHKYAETGWTEFRTASIVAQKLDELGYEIKLGREVIKENARMGVPSPEVLTGHYERAKAQGAKAKYLDKLQGGFTGVVALLKNGEGPTLAFRFDMDAVEMEESSSKDHLPVKEGFASVNDNAMHACGHDGHTAIGLGLAELLMEIKEEFKGTVKLIFQPAEEGVRGARSMMEAGVVDDVDYLTGLHLGLGNGSGELYPGTKGFLATSKFDACFKGKPSHAGAQPESGKNSLQAATVAVNQLYGISRHSQGVTRINVGRMEAGTGRNVIPDRAKLVIETRGTTSELNDYMYNRAVDILTNSAEMYGNELKINEMGRAESGKSDVRLAERIIKCARKTGEFDKIYDQSAEMGGSEDFTYFMKEVQRQGGLATFMILGTELAGSHHTADFNFKEKDLIKGVKILGSIVVDILK